MSDWTEAEAGLRDLMIYKPTMAGIVIHQEQLAYISAALRRIEQLEADLESEKRALHKADGVINGLQIKLRAADRERYGVGVS